MGKRQDTRDRIEREIVEVGRRHLVTDGAAGLSLRAIARDLGMVSSAVYRYVASRDDLLTLLLVDAYTELADAVDAAAGHSPGRRGATQLLAMARAARRWAVAQPGELGAAVRQPGARLSRAAELTVGPGTRVVGPAVRRGRAGIAAGRAESKVRRCPPRLGGLRRDPVRSSTSRATTRRC